MCQNIHSCRLVDERDLCFGNARLKSNHTFFHLTDFHEVIDEFVLCISYYNY